MCCFFHEFRVPFFLSLPLPLSLSLMKFIQIWSSVCFYLFIRLFVCLSWHIRNGTNETRLIFGWVLELTLWFIYSCLKSLQISYSLSLFLSFSSSLAVFCFLVLFIFVSYFLANRSRQWVIYQTACTQNDILIYWIYLFHNCARYRITKQSISQALPFFNFSLSFSALIAFSFTMNDMLWVCHINEVSCISNTIDISI